MHRMPAAASPLQQLRTALQSGAITPRAAVEQALARANSNSYHNVYLALDAERALRDADALPRRFPSAAARPLLYGLPISLKDCFDLQGFITTAGTRFYAERNPPAAKNSAVADRLQSQGAIIIGKTHMHPLAYGITGENPDYGDCTQPNNPNLLTGGSSSGAAASVQEDSAVAAIGTDTGGSIRAPAALCGLAGFRASIELAHERGLWRGAVHLSQSFDTLGWLFSDLSDAPLLGAALFDLPITAIASSVAQKVRIGVVAAEFLHDCHPAILQAFAQWQNRLAEHGAKLVPIETAYWEEAMSIYAPIQASEAAAIHFPATKGDFSHFEPTIAERLTWGASLTPGDIQKSRQLQSDFREKTDALLRTHDFLVLPCAPRTHLAANPNVGARFSASNPSVGAGLAPTNHANARRAILRYTTPMSLAGTPVISLPAANGAGVQLTSARGSDAILLSYAAHLGAQT
jgi:Asp-tRNA(Asn)/Glu-tRNA(Gln) amidotransferase A subunit family amidase